MMTNAMYPELQSLYRRFHSTETVLLKVTNDILMKMNSQEVTLLVMLDLSAAFDMVNHGILIRRLDEEVDLLVPQGSCLGPLLFIIYSSKPFKVIMDQLPEAHSYADDTQLY